MPLRSEEGPPLRPSDEEMGEGTKCFQALLQKPSFLLEEPAATEDSIVSGPYRAHSLNLNGVVAGGTIIARP